MANYFTSYAFKLDLESPATEEKITEFIRTWEAKQEQSNLDYSGIGDWELMTLEPHKLFFFSDEGPNHTPELIAAIQKRFKLNKPCIFMTAWTCDKSRTDSNGGGCYVIYRGRMRYGDTDYLALQMSKAMRIPKELIPQ